jgi:hypothetical protein
MPGFPQSLFPTIESVMDLARSIVNDMFPGIGGQNGRVLTDDAPFTIPYLNSAFRTLQRKLRNEGVTFETKDNVILFNLAPVVTPDPSVQVFVGFNGYNNGTQSFAQPQLPFDCLQLYKVWERTTGSNQPFVPMDQPQNGLPSVFQGNTLSYWEFRSYAIYMFGSILPKDLRLRYKAGQPPINVPPASFATTKVNILDSEDALAQIVARQYALARGAADVKALDDMIADTINDMVEEYVRRQQTVNYRRQPYGGDAWDDEGSGLGQTTWGS